SRAEGEPYPHRRQVRGTGGARRRPGGDDVQGPARAPRQPPLRDRPARGADRRSPAARARPGCRPAGVRAPARPHRAGAGLRTGGGVDPRGDIFALGLRVFEMLEGKRFFGGSDDEVRDILLHGKAPLLPQFSCIVPSGVSGLVGRALRRSPAHRQQSMAQVRSEIDACLRRLGERSAEAKPPRSVAIAVRRHPVLVVDEALEQPAEDQGPLPPSAASSETRPRRRVAVKVEPATSPLGIPGRVLARASGVPATSRRGLSIAGVILMAAAGLAASWPIFRTVTAVPSAPENASDVASVPVEQPAPATKVVAPPSPEPVAPVVDEEAPAPPASAAVPDRVAPAEEASQPDAAAGETTAVARLEPAPRGTPRIVSRRPQRGAIRLTEGVAIDFGVRASDQGVDTALAYAWFV